MSKLLSPRSLMTLLTVSIVLTALVVLDELEQAQLQASAEPVTPGLPLVSVDQISPGTQGATVKVLAKLEARYSSELTSQIEGQVTYLNDNLLAGNVFKKGDLLLSIDDSAHKAELANAVSELAQARIELLTEERQAAQAERDWQRSNLNQAPSSPLVLRQPQLAAAKEQLAAAEANVQHAKVLLGYTKIRAPFTGVVVRRDVNPGETLSTGQSIAQILALHTFDVVAQLDQKQWSLLAPDWAEGAGLLKDLATGDNYEARIRSGGHFLNPNTQLRNIYLTAKGARQGDLLPGQLMQVVLPGKLLENVLLVPESAYTRDSHLWLVGADDRLEKHPVDLLDSGEGQLTVSLPGPAKDSYRVVVFPQSNFFVGQLVKPNPYQPDADMGTEPPVIKLGAR